MGNLKVGDIVLVNTKKGKPITEDYMEGYINNGCRQIEEGVYLYYNGTDGSDLLLYSIKTVQNGDYYDINDIIKRIPQ